MNIISLLIFGLFMALIFGLILFIVSRTVIFKPYEGYIQAFLALVAIIILLGVVTGQLALPPIRFN